MVYKDVENTVTEVNADNISLPMSKKINLNRKKMEQSFIKNILLKQISHASWVLSVIFLTVKN